VATIESVEWMKHLDHTAASSSPLTVEIDVCMKKYWIFLGGGGGGKITQGNLCGGFWEEWHRARAMT